MLAKYWISPFFRHLFRRFHWNRLCRLPLDDAAEPLTEYENDPIGFCRNVLGVEPWSKQAEIMEALRDNPRVSVAACYASGKSYIAACCVLWWLMCRRPAMCITTAPTSRQVKGVLWRYIKQLIRKAKKKLPGKLLQASLNLSDDWFAMGFSSDAPNSVAGLHEASNVLFIEDEAAGMDETVVQGFDGITASPNSHHLKIGNPICDSGPFFDSHMDEEERKRWIQISISALETPNYLAQSDHAFHGLCPYSWVLDKEKRWRDRGLITLWKTKVLGEFCVTAGEKIVPSDWVKLAFERWDEVSDEGQIVIGVDIAGGGRDESVAAILRGRRGSILDNWSEPDQMEQARHIADLVELHGAHKLNVDSTAVGKGVYDKLCELQLQGRMPGCEINGISGGKSAFDSETFNRRSDEILWDQRLALDPCGRSPIALDPRMEPYFRTKLMEQVPLRGWHRNMRERIQAESKKELRKRGKSSPDYGDALANCTVREPEFFCFAA